jgi:RNA polymerase sigma-70 factor (ECF subfamily)
MIHTQELWQQHRERLLAFILSRGVEPDDAEDIVQEALARALARNGGPDDASRLTSWLYQVVRNAIADHWRRRRPTEDVSEEIADTTPDADDHRHLLGCLEPFLARLAPEDAEALRMADAQDRPQAEVAALLGLSLSGAKSRIQRARTRLMEMYRECCSVELDRRGRIVDHEPGPCPKPACGDGCS